MGIDFDVKGALDAGYTLPEVADYLGNKAQFDVAGARKSGYSDVDIIGSLTSSSAVEGLQGGTGNLSRGAQTAFGQTMPLAKGVVGLIGATAEQTFGEGGLSTALKNWGLNGYKTGMEKIQPMARDTDELTTAWAKAKQGDLGALVDWGTWAIGYGLGQAGEAAAMAAIGAVTGAALAPEAAPVTGAAGAVTGLVAKGAVKDVARSLIEKAVVKEANRLMAESGGKLAAEAATKQATKSVAASIGKGGALMGWETGMELGSIYPDAEEQARKGDRQLDGADLAKVWGTGILAGGVGAVGDKIGLDAVTGKLSSALPGGRLARTVGGAMAAGTSNAIEEGIQTSLERVGANKEVFSAEGQNDIINSMGAGFMGSAPAGAFGGIISRQRQNIAVEKGKAALDRDLSVGGAQQAIDAAAAELRGATDAYVGGVPPAAPPAGTVLPEMGAGGLLPKQLAAVQAAGLNAQGLQTREAATLPAAPALQPLASRQSQFGTDDALALRELAQGHLEQAAVLESQPNATAADLERAAGMRNTADMLNQWAVTIDSPQELQRKRNRVDLDERLRAQQKNAQFQADRDQAAEQLAGMYQKAEPANGTKYVELQPLTSRQAMNRIGVLRDMIANEGGNALGLVIVPHPTQSGKFAIAEKKLPSLKLEPLATPRAEQGEVRASLEAAKAAAPAQKTPEAIRAERAVSVIKARIEERGGIASPTEARLLAELGAGKPYDRIDETLDRPKSTDQRLTEKTGILVGSEAGLGYGSRESKIKPAEPASPSSFKLVERTAEERAVAQAKDRIERRGGVASPSEAKLLAETGNGTPFTKIDPRLEAASGAVKAVGVAAKALGLKASKGAPISSVKSRQAQGPGVVETMRAADTREESSIRGRLEHAAAQSRLAAQQTDDLQQALARPAGENPVQALSRIQGNATTQADVQQLIDASNQRRDAAETAEIERMLAEDEAQARANANAVAVASQDETGQAKAREIAAKARANLVDHLLERYAEPNGYFASAVIKAINKQLSILQRAPLSAAERARIEDLLARTRAFLQPNLPADKAAPAIDLGADNSSMERLIPERGAKGQAGSPKPKVPRPSKVGGVPTAQLTDEQLSATAGNDQLPAITRRGATVELQAREEERQAPAAQEQAPAAQEQAPAAQEQAPAAQEQAPAAQEQAPAAQEQAPAAEKPARQPTKLQQRAAFGKAIGAVVEAGGHHLTGRSNRKLGAAVEKGDWTAFAQALADSKNPVVARIGELALKLKGFSVGIDESAMESRSTADKYGTARMNAAYVELLDKLRDLAPKIAATTRWHEIEKLISGQRNEAYEKFFEEQVGEALHPARSFAASVQAVAPNATAFGSIYTKAEFNAVLKELEDFVADVGEDKLRASASNAGITFSGTVAGHYDAATKRVTAVYDRAARDEGIMAHEAAHAVLSDIIANPTPEQAPLVARLKELHDHVQGVMQAETDAENAGVDPRLHRQVHYGATSIQEFVAEGIGNPDFQYRLSRIAYQGKTAWGKFTEFVANLLGLKNDNAFTEFLAIQEQLTGPVEAGRKAPSAEVFATKAKAQEAQRQQPEMRVVKTDGGYTLAPKTEAQIAAQALAARRIAGNVGANGGPLNINQFLALRGGLAESEKSDLGVEGNVRVGSMWLFRKTGMTMDGAVQALREAGYLEADDHNEARSLIQRTLRGEPQYTPEGWERIAEAEAQSRFDDHLAAQQEAAERATDEWTPDAIMAEDFQVAPELAQADDALKAEVAALIDLAVTHDIDTESLLEDAANATSEGSENDYYLRARQDLQAAIAQSARSRRDEADGLGTQERPGQETQPGGRENRDEDSGGSGFALNQPTREEVVARQDQDVDTLDDLAQIRRESEAGAGLFELQREDGRQDNTGSLFSTQRTGDTGEVQSDGEAHRYTVVDGLTGQSGLTKVLREVARVFGKQVVFFQSDTLKADGFIVPGNNRDIHINADSKMSPMAVLGHEMMHLFKMDNPVAYRAIATVLSKQLDSAGRAAFRADYGTGANLNEFSADLLGNAFQDPGFLASVFAEIGATAPQGQARGIVERLVQALRDAIGAALQVIQDMGAQPGFKADSLVKDLQAVRSALRLAMTEYAKGQREQAGSVAEETLGGEAQASRQREQDQIETPAFKRWFGDSQVVDAEGKPLEVQHSTNSEFTAFARTENAHLGYHFGSAEQAKNRGGERTLRLYLSIKNPLRTIDAGDWSNPYRAWEVLNKKLKGSLDDLMPKMIAQTSRQDRLNELTDAVKGLGYDGIVYKNRVEGRGDSWIAFSPEQIKSAIGNNGEFDPANPDITMSRQRIFGDNQRQRTPEQLQMMKNIGRSVEVPTIKERIASLRKDLGKRLVQGIFDQFDPLKSLGGKAYQLARLSKGASGAMEAVLHHGKLSLRDGVFDADMSGGVLERLGKPLHGEFDDFLNWVAGNRAERLMLQGRENLFSRDDIRAAKTLADGTTDFDYTLQHGPDAGQVTRDRTRIYDDALKTFNEFNKNVLDIAEQSGLIDPESRKVWESEFYVPFYRVSEEGYQGDTLKDGLVRQQVIKTLKGGTDKLNDLMDNTLMNWAHLIDASAKNRAALASLKSASELGVAIEASETVARQMAKAGGVRSQVVWAMDEGQRRYFVVEDKAMLQALTSLQFAGLKGPIMDAMGTFKHALTVGVTASPAFKIRNLARDSVQAISSAPLSYNLFKNLADGYRASDPKSQTYVSALASGGLIRFGTMIEGNEAARTRQLIKMGVKDWTILNSQNKLDALWSKIEKGFMAYQELGNRGEEINRAALYKQLVDQGVPHGEAALQARDLMDFSLQGTFTTVRFLAQVVPFLNARLQGLYKLGRAGKEDPRRFAVVLGSVALASVALMMAYKDDDDWKKREDWDRNNYWWFKFGGLAYRIPKPFEIGAIATLAERGLDYFINPEMTGQRLYENVRDILMDQLSMNPIPQAIKPIIDVYSNKDSFSGRPIEPMGMDKLRPDYRYTLGTSMLARGVSSAGQAVAGAAGGNFLSPMQVDHLLHGYFSWLGSFVVGASDMALRPLTGQPDRPTADYWKVATQGIVQEANSPQSRYVSQMYQQAKEIEQAYATWQMLLKQGRVDEAWAYRDANIDTLQKYGSVEHVKKAETKLNERIRMIERSSLSADEKREHIQQLQERRDQIARLLVQ